MRIAVLSDIHGNADALDAALADLSQRPVDHVVCLGDAIQGGPQPAAVVARLRDLGCPVVMGNADAYLLTGEDSGAEPTTDARQRQLDAVRAWSLAQLSEADRAFIAAFMPTVAVPLAPGRQLLCYHGSPHSFDDVLLPLTPDDVFQHALDPHEGTFFTGGHTHVQFVRHFARTFHFNPGSVGFAWRHGQPPDAFRADPWAEYAIFTADGDGVALEFRRVPFDAARYRRVIRESGMPHAALSAERYE